MLLPRDIFSSQAKATPPQDPLPRPLTSAHDSSKQDNDNEEEWEYEYSATETETYYVTLDLTTPNVPTKPRPIPTGSAKNQMRWTNPGIGRNKRKNLTAPPTFKAGPSSTIDKDGPEDPDAENEEDAHQPSGNDDNQEDVSKPQEQGDPNRQENARCSTVQILDLHTENPIVSYDGHVYSCQWAANIGTELLFTSHDSSSTMPILRTLPEDVDLLAASSARIISNSVELKPKVSSRKVVNPKLNSRNPRNSGIIPVGSQASDKRKDQARFLEQMMEIKDRKGEADMVTVHTKKRMTGGKLKIELKNMRAIEKKKLRATIKRQGDIAAVEAATTRLQEIEKEEEMLNADLGETVSRFNSGRKKKVRIAEEPVEITSGRLSASSGKGKKAAKKYLVISGDGIRDDEDEEEVITAENFEEDSGDEEMQDDGNRNGGGDDGNESEEEHLYDEEELGDEDAQMYDA